MIDQLDKFDKNIFLCLNNINHPILDDLFWILTSKFGWIPIGLLISFFIIKFYKKDSIYFFVFLTISITIADQFSSGFCKPYFKRIRPCNDPEIGSMVHIVNHYCSNSFSFISSHATNSLAIGTFTHFFLNNKIIRLTLFIWISLHVYSRIYLGVHYPLDILTGVLVGSMIGIGFGILCKWILAKYSID